MPRQIRRSFLRIAGLSMTYKEAAGSLRFLGELHYAEVYSSAPGRDIQPQSHWSFTRNRALARCEVILAWFLIPPTESLSATSRGAPPAIPRLPRRSSLPGARPLPPALPARFC